MASRDTTWPAYSAFAWVSAEYAGQVVSLLAIDGHSEPTVQIILLQAVLPNPDFDSVIEGGTAVGVHQFIAVEAERSVARPPAARVARWQAIAESAAEQSH